MPVLGVLGVLCRSLTCSWRVTFIIGDAIQDGTLRSILTDYNPTDLVVSALYPRQRHLSAKVRLFIELLEERFGGRPYWDVASQDRPDIVRHRQHRIVPVACE